mmetsp:Transcript_32958/g.57862  ORF Transcript_32958/g.57862 Transcript_32958/m.57862 type:complete len:174 (-) Transcript_32958:3084-3605(-)|eukprot:CAMPEP_0204919198 /NCGR_PEP_ID=MMETSP1397-20131031/16692_1 /ASSEMBLY_ACC=CAM_ASM_000891 /TAXON_ID=49980 /ORGANISM="Climacostomum Climacostomum virens, Strain Stock W-24" /LENGTH=173 /DNA_ID=CAMNT_0052092773 /DNA_START=10 /DNA_END=531 /DNA_ORIENTATION=+
MRTRSTSNLAFFKPEPQTFEEIDAFMTPRKRRASEDSLNFKDSSTIGSPSEFDYDDYDKNEIKRRKRKTAAQVKLLKREYNANPVWSKETYVELAAKTGLSESQVYKWSWDYRKKLRKRESKVSVDFLYCTEVLSPTPLDSALYVLQRSYRGAWKSITTNTVSSTPSRFLAAN